MKEQNVENREEEFPGYPSYPESEDIYSNQLKEDDIDPDNVSERTLPNLVDAGISGDVGAREVLDDYDVVGSELDIPGTELDDVQESLGTEDEENNYYSLGGDNHESLEEDSEGI